MIILLQTVPAAPSYRPKALTLHRRRYVSACLQEGMTLTEAHHTFERANRRLWAEALR